MGADSHLPGGPLPRSWHPRPLLGSGPAPRSTKGWFQDLHLPRRGAWGTSRGASSPQVQEGIHGHGAYGRHQIVGRLRLDDCLPAEQGSELPSHPEFQTPGALKSQGSSWRQYSQR